jgi:Holliday junction resolvase RusA-like endonuclease
MIEFTIPGEPVPFARAGSRFGRRYTPAKQLDYMLYVRSVARAAMAGRDPLCGAIAIDIAATFAIPASWSKKKQAAAKWHVARPDYDNLAKIVGDSLGASVSLTAHDKLGAIVYSDDSQIARATVEKRYGDRPCMRVRVNELEEVRATPRELHLFGERAEGV